MNTAQIIALAPQTIGRTLQRWWIRRKLAHVRYQLLHIRNQQNNDRAVERVLMGREALLQSDLRQI